MISILQFYRVLVYKEESRTLVFKTFHKMIIDRCGTVVLFVDGIMMGWVSPSGKCIARGIKCLTVKMSYFDDK